MFIANINTRVTHLPHIAAPTYPAGMIKTLQPPTYDVTPPSLSYTRMALTEPHVIQHAMAWLISCRNVVNNRKGYIIGVL